MFVFLAAQDNLTGFVAVLGEFFGGLFVRQAMMFGQQGDIFLRDADARISAAVAWALEAVIGLAGRFLFGLGHLGDPFQAR